MQYHYTMSFYFSSMVEYLKNEMCFLVYADVGICFCRYILKRRRKKMSFSIWRLCYKILFEAHYLSRRVSKTFQELGRKVKGKNNFSHLLTFWVLGISITFYFSAAFLTQTVCLDDTTVKFEIWDTAGQERYHSLAPMYYRGAQAAIVVYDITSQVCLIEW